MQTGNIALDERLTFAKQAEAAAELERNGKFNNAAFIWSGAAHLARREQNRHWAESRSQFCEKWAWRYEKEAA